MNAMTPIQRWNRYDMTFVRDANTGFSLDISRMNHPDSIFETLAPEIARATEIMQQVERGDIANPDENRMVGHYWLRSPERAPTAELGREIRETNARIVQFAADVHAGAIAPAQGGRFERVLLVGIGGSALGPQFIADALAAVDPPMTIEFFDNTDPDGIQRHFQRHGSALARTLVLVVSKSGGTRETRNGMLETAAAFKAQALDFPRHTVAITGVGSELDKHARAEDWIARFPMWDWVGGRTSVMSPVGMLPMALQGIDIDAFLCGASKMDEWTRSPDARCNPAMLLALMWHHAGAGRGLKDMVILPYKDRLVLFSKYLQQLVMESLGKERDLEGRTVHQGIAVYGNKGSTDQHAYVQQLRDGVNNFFVTFLEVAKAQDGTALEVDPGVTSGDYLQGFLRGTRTALTESGRESITLSLPELSPFHIGALIALYERAVGYYAGLISINAYHQPGVEAGKTAATRVLELQSQVVAQLAADPARADTIAAALDAAPEDVYHILRHLAANGRAHLKAGACPAEDLFSA